MDTARKYPIRRKQLEFVSDHCFPNILLPLPLLLLLLLLLIIIIIICVIINLSNIANRF